MKQEKNFILISTCFPYESRYCGQWDLSLATFFAMILIHEISDNFELLFICSNKRSCEVKKKMKLGKMQVNLCFL